MLILASTKIATEILAGPNFDILCLPLFDGWAIGMLQLPRKLGEQVVDVVMNAGVGELCGRPLGGAPVVEPRHAEHARRGVC